MEVTIKKSTLNKVHVDGFYNWMLKIKNIHYANNEQMSRAYERINPTI